MNSLFQSTFKRIKAIPEKDREFLIKVIDAVEERDGFTPGEGRGHLFLTRLYLQMVQKGETEADWYTLLDKADAGIKAKMIDTIECVEHTLDDILELVQQEPQTSKPAVPKTPKDVSPWDNNGLGRVPCNHFVAEHLGAQMLGGKDWESKVCGFQYESETQKAPIIRKDCSGGGRIQITLATPPDAAEQTTDQIREAVSATLKQYGGLSVDVTLALLAILGDPRQVEYPLIQHVYITTKTILKSKGFERYGKDGRLMEQQVADIVNALAKLRLYFRGVQIDGRGPITIEDGKLFDIEKTYKEQKDIDGNWIMIETGWVLRLGLWVNLFLHPDTRLWIGSIARDVMELDHRDNRQAAQMAKFIWVRFLGCPAGRFHENQPTRVRVEVLLQKIGYLPEVQERGPHWYRRTRENLEQALGKLLGLGAVARWNYSDDVPHIEDKAARNSGTSNEERWLKAHITLIDPASLPEAERRKLLPPPDDEHPYNRALRRAFRIDEARERKKLPKPRRERLAPKKHTPLANAQERLKLPETRAALKKKRLDMGLHQAELARQLGISRQAYGNIERGEFAPGDKTGTAEKLMAWLDKPEGEDE